jgi:branched-chain amino acid transport system substrate-binding protein
LSRRLTLVLCALLLGGCLGDDHPEESSRISGDTVTVYSSLPHHGVSAPVARAVAAGERLALTDARGRAGMLRVRLVQLDSTDPEDRLWDPDRVSTNAKRGADDPTAIAYLGELDYGASAVSVPITNEAGILQVSPGDGLTSLTDTPPGRPPAGPDRLYPTGKRSFLRLTPSDQLEAETMLERIRADGARRLAVLFDQQVYGRELGEQLVALGRRDGPEPVRSEEYHDSVEETPDLARKLAESRPDAVAYAGVAGRGTGPLLAAIDARLPGVPVYASDGILARDPARPIPAAPNRVEALSPFPPLAELPRAGARLLNRLRATSGPAVARPEALYGYESMRLVLDAIAAAGPERARAIRSALRIRTRRAPVGRYQVWATGDVGEERFAVYELRDGRFQFDEMAR